MGIDETTGAAVAATVAMPSTADPDGLQRALRLAGRRAGGEHVVADHRPARAARVRRAGAAARTDSASSRPGWPPGRRRRARPGPAPAPTRSSRRDPDGVPPGRGAARPAARARESVGSWPRRRHRRGPRRHRHEHQWHRRHELPGCRRPAGHGARQQPTERSAQAVLGVLLVAEHQGPQQAGVLPRRPRRRQPGRARRRPAPGPRRHAASRRTRAEQASRAPAADAGGAEQQVDEASGDRMPAIPRAGRPARNRPGGRPVDGQPTYVERAGCRPPAEPRRARAPAGPRCRRRRPRSWSARRNGELASRTDVLTDQLGRQRRRSGSPGDAVDREGAHLRELVGQRAEHRDRRRRAPGDVADRQLLADRPRRMRPARVAPPGGVPRTIRATTTMSLPGRGPRDQARAVARDQESTHPLAGDPRHPHGHAARLPIDIRDTGRAARPGRRATAGRAKSQAGRSRSVAPDDDRAHAAVLGGVDRWREQ